MEINEKLLNKNGIVRVIVFILLTIPFFQVDYLVAKVSFAGKAYTAAQILAGLIIIFLFVKDHLVKRIPKFFVLFLALLFVLILASWLNKAGLKRSMEYSFATFMLCLLVVYGILKDLRSFLKAEIVFFGGLTVLNLITVLVFKNGMYTYLDYYTDCWLLGHKSGHIIYQIPFLFFTAIYISVFLKSRAKWIILFGAEVIVLASTLLVKNSTALVSLVPVIIVSMVPMIRRFTPIFNSIIYGALGLVMNLLFVVFRKQGLFKWFIADVLHKRMDFTYRTAVWDSAFEAIKEKPKLGHGYQTFTPFYNIETAHNEYLEILYKMGIIGLAVFLAVIVYVIYRLFKNRKNEQAQWVALFTGAFFVMFVMEQYAFVYFFYLFVFAYFSQNLVKLAKEQDLDYMEKINSRGEVGRVEKSARNMLFTMFASVTAIIIGLVAQKIFIRILGLEYAGLNGLFSNVITMLAIADLGIGEAVVFNLYRPIKENDEDAIRSLMAFYKKAFHIVAIVIAVIGVCLIPILPYIAKPTEANVNLTAIFLIFLADVVLSYFLSYKRAILYADQKNYYISIIHMIYLVGMNITQLLVLYFTHNFYAYLISKVVFRVLENFVITCVANKKYPYLTAKKADALPQEIKADIKKKTGALFFHKIGTFVVNGTDNILISVFFNLTTAGLYSNYYLVTDALTKLFTPSLAALTPSVGNMLVSESKEHIFQTFRRIRFMNFWIASLAATALMVLMQPFISLWFGSEYLLSFGVVVVLSLQFFQLLMRGTFNSFQDAAGIFYENRFVPLVESVINIAASIILLKIFGLAGVFAGTIVSSLALWGFSYPKFVYKKIFGRSIKQYVLETTGYFGLFVTECLVTYGIITRINTFISTSGIMLLLVDGFICMILTNVFLAVIFAKSDCLKYYAAFLRSKIKKA